mmetsp:Transcript_167568/g.538112  ORF Transcript_167568/g.538112 Transcript_167568/m.538112 type:complete len:550 (-) Transcript_167568:117-1766(-)
MQAVQRLFRGSDEEITWEEPVCLQCQRTASDTCKHCAVQCIIVDRDRVVTRYVGPERLPLLPTQLPMIDGDWKWLRQANSDLHRATRLDACQLLLTSFQKGGYAMRTGGKTQCVKFRHLKEMRKKTIVLDVSQALPKLPQQPIGVRTTMDHFAGGTPAEKAVELTREGFKVTAVSAASAYSPGGGFTKGGRHALEEALCSQSTLYHSLEEVKERMLKNKKVYQIPEFGVIVSPRVEFFRRGTDQGYALYGGRETLEAAAIVSMAMYNRNPAVRDSPLDAPASQQEYEKGVERKFTAMAHAAALSESDALVIPDVGCGVFRNDPAVVGRLAGIALRKYIGYFRCVIFTGQRPFYEAARQALAEVDIGNRPPKPLGDVDRTTMAPSTCVVCKQMLGRDLAVVIGPKGERRGLFMHEECSDLLANEWPDHTAMTLPRAAESPEEFLRALDVDGNGMISKEELRSVVMALGCLDQAQFEARFKEWDRDGSGNLTLDELKRVPNKVHGEVLSMQQLPRSLLDWVKDQATLREQSLEAASLGGHWSLDSGRSRWS